MIWINIINDSFASLAFSTEYPDLKLLKKPPNTKEESLISKRIFKHMIFHSIELIPILLIVLIIF